MAKENTLKIVEFSREDPLNKVGTNWLVTIGRYGDSYAKLGFNSEIGKWSIISFTKSIDDLKAMLRQIEGGLDDCGWSVPFQPQCSAGR